MAGQALVTLALCVGLLASCGAHNGEEHGATTVQPAGNYSLPFALNATGFDAAGEMLAVAPGSTIALNTAGSAGEVWRLAGVPEWEVCNFTGATKVGTLRPADTTFMLPTFTKEGDYGYANMATMGNGTACDKGVKVMVQVELPSNSTSPRPSGAAPTRAVPGLGALASVLMAVALAFAA